MYRLGPVKVAETDQGASADYFLRLLGEIGRPLSPGAMVLDFGCGEGGLVEAFVERGFDAHGCDFPEELGTSERLLAIERPYRLPYSDATFACVLSNQVFEHVQDYPLALAELLRVLAPTGTSLHIFPARYCLREPHTFVPLATVIQSRWWLALWAALGVRNQFQEGKSAREVTELNYAFLRDHTTYYTRRRLLAHAREHFSAARLLGLEPLSIATGRAGRTLYAVARHVPCVARLWSELRSRMLLLAR